VKGAATVGGDERLRLFLALELPDEVKSALEAWRDRHLRELRPADALHATLAFLGNRPRSDLEGVLGALRASVDETPPFLLEPVRYRETRSVGMLVLDDSSGEATRLADRLQSRLEELGVYRREARLWLPHVTVVRFRQRPRMAPPAPDIGPFAPSGAAAFLSRLHPSGARYEVIESCSLGARPGERPAEDVESGG
jgi:RNA 2',3'-cyclic 3'-phosphodiesterase